LLHLGDHQKMTAHKTVKLEVDGETVEIDKAIVALIQAINTVQGVRTQYCCRNGGGLGYVAFGRAEDTGRSLFQCVRFQSRMLDNMNTELIVANSNGEDIALANFSAEAVRIVDDGPQFCIRWNPNFYQLVLRAALKTAEQLVARDKVS
jgi:hypothetical protein